MVGVACLIHMLFPIALAGTQVCSPTRFFSEGGGGRIRVKQPGIPSPCSTTAVKFRCHCALCCWSGLLCDDGRHFSLNLRDLVALVPIGRFAFCLSEYKAYFVLNFMNSNQQQTDRSLVHPWTSNLFLLRITKKFAHLLTSTCRALPASEVQSYVASSSKMHTAMCVRSLESSAQSLG